MLHEAFAKFSNKKKDFQGELLEDFEKHWNKCRESFINCLFREEINWFVRGSFTEVEQAALQLAEAISWYNKATASL